MVKKTRRRKEKPKNKIKIRGKKPLIRMLKDPFPLSFFFTTTKIHTNTLIKNTYN